MKDPSSGADISDAVGLLHFLFVGDASIATPFPACGREERSIDVLGCRSYPPCR